MLPDEIAPDEDPHLGDVPDRLRELLKMKGLRASDAVLEDQMLGVLIWGTAQNLSTAVQSNRSEELIRMLEVIGASATDPKAAEEAATMPEIQTLVNEAVAKVLRDVDAGLDATAVLWQ